MPGHALPPFYITLCTAKTYQSVQDETGRKVRISLHLKQPTAAAALMAVHTQPPPPPPPPSATSLNQLHLATEEEVKAWPFDKDDPIEEQPILAFCTCPGNKKPSNTNTHNMGHLTQKLDELQLQPTSQTSSTAPSPPSSPATAKKKKALMTPSSAASSSSSSLMSNTPSTKAESGSLSGKKGVGRKSSVTGKHSDSGAAAAAASTGPVPFKCHGACTQDVSAVGREKWCVSIDKVVEHGFVYIDDLYVTGNTTPGIQFEVKVEDLTQVELSDTEKQQALQTDRFIPQKLTEYVKIMPVDGVLPKKKKKPSKKGGDRETRDNHDGSNSSRVPSA